MKERRKEKGGARELGVRERARERASERGRYDGMKEEVRE